MNSEELKNLIESARVEKGISQRELAKLTGISRSTLNDLINGKIKKVDIDDLRKIAETLDMSFQKLFYTIENLQIMKDNKDSLYTIDKAIEDIQFVFDELEFAEHKYDYSKLPKKN